MLIFCVKERTEVLEMVVSQISEESLRVLENFWKFLGDFLGVFIALGFPKRFEDQFVENTSDTVSVYMPVSVPPSSVIVWSGWFCRQKR